MEKLWIILYFDTVFSLDKPHWLPPRVDCFFFVVQLQGGAENELSVGWVISKERINQCGVFYRRVFTKLFVVL